MTKHLVVLDEAEDFFKRKSAGHSEIGRKMIVEKSTVEKITIKDIPNLDAVSVFIEDFGVGYGKTTITCSGDCWSNSWNGLGQATMAEFLLRCDKQYLAGKFSPQTNQSVTVKDSDVIQKFLHGKILELRREFELEKEQSREYWDNVDALDTDNPSNMNDVCQEILGDEWWYQLPEEANHDYEYLCSIIDAVKAALVELKNQAVVENNQGLNP